MITKCHEKVLCYHIIYIKIYFVMYVVLSVCLVCVGVLEKVGGSHRVTGCAEVNEPLCGSSYPVYSLLYQQKKELICHEVHCFFKEHLYHDLLLLLLLLIPYH